MRITGMIAVTILLLACWGCRSASAPAMAPDAAPLTQAVDAFQEVATSEEYQSSVVESDLPVMVKFYSPGCGACRLVSHTLGSVTPRYAGRMRFVAVNVEEARGLAEPFRLRGVPTLVFFRNGREVKRLVGNHTEQTLRRAIEDTLL